jgi:hypothetical protein
MSIVNVGKMFLDCGGQNTPKTPLNKHKMGLVLLQGVLAAFMLNKNKNIVVQS